MMTIDECVMYDEIVDRGIATPEELNLARNLVSGTWEEVMDAVVNVRTGYKTFLQYLECENEQEEEVW